MAKSTPPATAKRWSHDVHSDALDLEAGVFTWSDPRAIAESLKASAERSKRRKSSPFSSAMSMLTFYINRAGRDLPDAQRQCLEAAKDELRELFGRARRQPRGVSPSGRGSPSKRRRSS